VINLPTGLLVSLKFTEITNIFMRYLYLILLDIQSPNLLLSCETFFTLLIFIRSQC